MLLDQYSRAYSQLQTRIQVAESNKTVFYPLKLIFWCFQTAAVSLFVFIFIYPETTRRSGKSQDNFHGKQILKSLSTEYSFLPDMKLMKLLEISVISDYFNNYSGLFDFKKNIFLPNATSNPSLLDIGCGNGKVFSTICRATPVLNNFHCDGLDIYEQEKNSIYQNIYFTCASDLNPSLAGKYDFIVLNCVIEHLPNIEKVIANIALWLKPGGRCIFTTPHPTIHRNHLFVKILDWAGFSSVGRRIESFLRLTAIHYNLFTKSEWEALFSKNQMTYTSSRDYLTHRSLNVYDSMNINSTLFPKMYTWNMGQYLLARFPKILNFVQSILSRYENLLLRICFGFDASLRNQYASKTHCLYVFKKSQ